MAGISINKDRQNYKWYILILVMLTDMFVITIPLMGVSVLAKEIADDLKLNLLQVGIIWGVGALPGIATSLLGGAIGDKIGPKRVLVVGTLMGDLLGAARGLVDGFLSMTIETKNVGPLYAGTAVGFAMALGSIGNLIAPPVGNSLAALWPGAPFAFWSLLAALGFICLSFVKEKVKS